MGIVSLNDMDRIFWAGRYCERAIFVYNRYTALPSDSGVRIAFSESLGLDCGVDLPDDMIYGYVRDAARSWRDNALCLRHVFGSRAVRLAESAFDSCERNDFDGLVIHGYAFFGMVEDRLSDSTARSFFIAGRMTERMDLMSRFGEETYLIEEAIERLIASASDSKAVEKIIGKCALEMITFDVSEGNAEAVKRHTPYILSNNEYS